MRTTRGARVGQFPISRMQPPTFDCARSNRRISGATSGIGCALAMRCAAINSVPFYTLDARRPAGTWIAYTPPSPQAVAASEEAGGPISYFHHTASHVATFQRGVQQ